MFTISSFKGQYDFLSNFYTVMPGVLWPDESSESEKALYWRSLEHAYQASKFGSHETRIVIQQARTAADAKKLGKTGELRNDWEIVKLSVMMRLLRMKFADPFLAKRLLETQDIELIEGNHWHDTYWGVCNGVGRNELGKALMLVRAELYLAAEGA